MKKEPVRAYWSNLIHVLPLSV